ncbi:hypothetical protein CkaCkLH20_07611 [Colletotrichum karsti]|uniref:Uncharacterized protein n=1 Tax=Colletotrichum karsti TaxID=1095194 RepID=A0A9P6I0W6_9PEZI|nr:uncharacterized protein CkaCkLH20_07611 [Colletotrichum karsti]KAF9874917.1 hypothetical protein CkaCkLH20_07611 [Colletotrichum karsti]
MSKPTPSQHTYPGSPGALMGLLSTSVVTWLLLGAMAYSDAIAEEAQFVLNLFLCVVLVTTLSLASAELPSAGQSRRGASRGSAYYTASVTGFGASIVYALVSSNWDSGHKRLFWGLGGFYGGILLEAATGFYAACARRLRESMYESETETGVSEAQVSEPRVSEPPVPQAVKQD